jgi:hypothetical protein
LRPWRSVLVAGASSEVRVFGVAVAASVPAGSAGGAACVVDAGAEAAVDVAEPAAAASVAASVGLVRWQAFVARAAAYVVAHTRRTVALMS